MWGRSEPQIGRYCKEWVPHWGKAGKDLSILETTAPYLEKYMPESYKVVGLEKIAAVPDGKDFMTDTARSNTIITRSQFSDKVHNSAVKFSFFHLTTFCVCSRYNFVQCSVMYYSAMLQ